MLTFVKRIIPSEICKNLEDSFFFKSLEETFHAVTWYNLAFVIEELELHIHNKFLEIIH